MGATEKISRSDGNGDSVVGDAVVARERHLGRRANSSSTVGNISAS